MSSNDLRTRIAAAACDATSAGRLLPWDTLSPPLREPWYEVADAIIRELGLTRRTGHGPYSNQVWYQTDWTTEPVADRNTSQKEESK